MNVRIDILIQNLTSKCLPYSLICTYTQKYLYKGSIIATFIQIKCKPKCPAKDTVKYICTCLNKII